MARYIGIRHRVKMTADGESSPTQLAVRENGEVKLRTLDTEEDELVFVTNELQPGDTIAMMLGGSGDYLAYALSRRGIEVGAQVLRIPPFDFAALRGDEKKEHDAMRLAELAELSPERFYPVTDRDRGLIVLRERLFARTDAMKARIACEQRIRSRVIGGIFCTPTGLYPEGGIEKLFDEAKANDTILQALLKEEQKRNRDLAKAAESLDVYRLLLGPVEGCGPRIAAAIIGGIIDIRRFETSPKLKAYCGVHVLPDGRFARKRRNELANWNSDIRQALVLLAKQFQYRPDSEWGQYLRKMKANLRERHPEPVVLDGKKRYSDGHINKMAEWRTLTRFVEWLHREWWKLERAQVVEGDQESVRKAA